MAKIPLSKVQTFLNQGKNSVSFYIKQTQVVVRRLFAPEICETHENCGSGNLRTKCIPKCIIAVIVLCTTA